MENYEEILHAVSLFQGIATNELESMLGCLQAQTIEYKKGETLLTAGSKPQNIGILLSGQLQIMKDDADGNHTLLATLAPPDIFAEALCCAGVEESPVTVATSGDSLVLMLKFSRILHVCPKSCAFHHELIKNMLGIIARKNLYLQSRMEIIRIKSIRAKVISYLENLSAKQGRRVIVPFNREEMADYLCVDRSALSHELMKMKRDGLIDYHRNTFKLL